MKLLLLLWLFTISDPIDGRFFKCDPKRFCGCSHSNVEINARINGGEEAVRNSWSMVVSVRYDFARDGNFTVHACGGTILTESYILTAGQCFDGISNDFLNSNLSIAAGIHRRSQPLQIVREIDRIIVHPNWTGTWSGYHHDIALVHLSVPLDFERFPYISRTCLSPQLNISAELIRYPTSNIALAVVGWGQTKPYGDDSDVLRQIVTTSITHDDAKCTKLIHDPSSQFCASTEVDEKGPCYGDQGGPIFQWMKDHWEQVGITSFSSDTCRQNSPTVFTRIAYYRDWIEEQIGRKTDSIGEMSSTTTMPSVSISETPTIIYECDRNTVPCGCSRRNVQFLISNTNQNHEAVPYSWSMIVSIRANGNNGHLCSGSILAESYILTSASCVAKVPAFGLSIAAGVHNYSEDLGTYRSVNGIFLHPEYTGSSDNYANDIAILHLSQPLDFDNDLFISRICLAQKNEEFPDPTFYPAPGSRLEVTGWGSLTCENQTAQPLLQQVQVYAINDLDKSCSILSKNRDTQFCATVEDGAKVPCVEDFGSPIFQWLGDRWQQVGIASFRPSCTQPVSVPIYTRLVEYISWINSITHSDSTTTTAADSTTTFPSQPPVLYRCNTSSTCGCGSNPVLLTPARIVGGENAKEHSWPMMVSLQRLDTDMHRCGGSILSESFILTAAHCVRGYITDGSIDVSIAVGMTNLSDPQRIQRTVSHIYVHPKYIGGLDGYRNDIALLQLNQSLPFTYDSLLRKTCIHRVDPPTLSSEYIKSGTPLTVIGWGDLGQDFFQYPQTLQQVQVLAIDNADPICITAMNDSSVQFCAGLPQGGKDSCQADSGGPIFQWTGQYWEQLGIVSYGDGCAQMGKPGVYTRLSYYYDWMNDILKNSSEHLEPDVSSYITSSRPETSTINATTPISKANVCENQGYTFSLALLQLLFAKIYIKYIL